MTLATFIGRTFAPIFLIFAAAPFLSAADAQSAPPKTLETSVIGNGFSIAWPAGSQWRQVSDEPTRVAFVKGLNKRFESVAASVMLFPLPPVPTEVAFAAVVSAGIRHDDDPARFTVLSSTAGLSEACGPFCYRFDTSVLDRSPASKPRKLKGLIMRRRGYYKRHPDNPGVGILVDFSERTADPKGLADFEVQADRFSDGLELSTLR